MTDILSKVPKVSNFITSRALDEESVLMDLKTLRTYALNETASSVWKEIDGHSTVKEIIKKISGDYGIPQEHCQNDIIETFVNFKEENLILF